MDPILVTIYNADQSARDLEEGSQATGSWQAKLRPFVLSLPEEAWPDLATGVKSAVQRV